MKTCKCDPDGKESIRISLREKYFACELFVPSCALHSALYPKHLNKNEINFSVSGKGLAKYSFSRCVSCVTGYQNFYLRDTLDAAASFL